MPFDQEAQQLGRLLGRVRVHGDHLAPLAAARHLQLCLARVDGAAEPAQLLLRLGAFHVEVGAEPPRVQRHSGLQRESLDGREVDDQDMRVVEVLARQLAQRDRPPRVLEDLMKGPVEADVDTGRIEHLKAPVDVPRAVRHERRVLLDVEPLAVAVRRAVDQRPAAIALESAVSDHARVEPLARHRLHGITPDLGHGRHALASVPAQVPTPSEAPARSRRAVFFRLRWRGDGATAVL